MFRSAVIMASASNYFDNFRTPFDILIGEVTQELSSLDVEVVRSMILQLLQFSRKSLFWKTALLNISKLEPSSAADMISILRDCRFLSKNNLGLLKDLLTNLTSEALLSKVEELEKSEKLKMISLMQGKSAIEVNKTELRLHGLPLYVYHGNIVTDRGGSRFQAHFAKLTAVGQREKVLDYIMNEPKYTHATIAYSSNLYDPTADSLNIDVGNRQQKLLGKFQVDDIIVITTFWGGERYLYQHVNKKLDECVLSLLMSHGLIDHISQEKLSVFLDAFEADFEESLKNSIKVTLSEPETQKRDFVFIQSEVIEDSKSKFQAHLACVTSPEQVEQALQQLKRDNEIARAGTNIVAYRIHPVKETNIDLEKGNDDGGSEGGKRILHLLQVCKVVKVVVIVTCMDGGVNIGADRFKHVNACAMEVIRMATEKGMINIGAPIEIICRGPKALAAYENALLNGTTKNRRQFLMLIGPSRSGKTSLMKSFRGEVFDPNEDSTYCIALHRYCCKLVDRVWVKDSAIEDEISFESVMSMNIAKNYKSGVDGGTKETTEGIAEHDDSEKVVDSEIVRKESSHNENIEILDDPARHIAVKSEKENSGRIQGVDKSSFDPRMQVKTLDVLANQKTVESEDNICTVLDIGGQPVYDVTHPLFISTKGLFILVHNLENDTNNPSVPVVKKGNARRQVVEKCMMTNMDHLEFWLSFVALNVTPQNHNTSCPLMPRKLPPVFLACTHADTPFDGQDAKAMSREILKHLKRKEHQPGEHLVSCLYPVDNTLSGSSEDKGVRVLRKDICELAKCLPHMNEDIPVRWFRFEKELLSLKEKYRYLSTEAAKKIAHDCKVDVKSGEFFTVLNYLHDIREIIFFEGTETVYIDIQWLINMISKVITVEPFENWQEEHSDSWSKLENEGVLDVSLLEYVWKEVADDKHAIDSLLVIMERFSLLYRWKTHDKKDVFLVPAMLMNSSPRDIAELLKDQMSPLIVYFEISHLPLGIFPRLQVMFSELCNRKWSSASQPKFHHNFCRFFDVGEDESFDLVLTSDIRTICIGVIKNNGDDDQIKVTDFCQEVIEFLKTKLGTEMRKDFPWMARMEYNLCIRCPICKPSPGCSLPHVPGCVSPACVHYITEEEVLKGKRLRCLKNPTFKVTDISPDCFSHWFPKPEKSSASKPVHGASPETVPLAIPSTTGSLSLDDNSKRWVVVGIAIMKVLLPALRDFLLPKITKHYNDLKANHNIHTQIHGAHLKMDGTYKLNYDSINNNQGKKPPLFDYMVTSEVDLAKLYLKPFMAKFTGIDESCDLSAVLGILSSASIFTAATQNAAKDVRQDVRNEWGHCNFSKWDEAKITDCFKFMDVLVKSLSLAGDEEKKLLEELKEWEENGVALCLGKPVDGDLLKLVHENASLVLTEVQSLKESNAEEYKKITSALQAFQGEVVKSLKKLEEGQEDIKTMIAAVGSDVNDVKTLLVQSSVRPWICCTTCHCWDSDDER